MSQKDTKVASPQIQELISKIDKAQAELAFCKTSFEANTQLVLKELKEGKKQSVDESKGLDGTLLKFKATCENLDSVARTISMAPEKVDEKLSTFPKSFNNSISQSIPQLSEDLCRALEDGVKSFTIQAGATLNATNSQMTSAVQKLKGNTDQLHYDMRNELKIYANALEKIIDKGSKFRMRSFFWTVFLSSITSSAIAITTFYLIAKV